MIVLDSNGALVLIVAGGRVLGVAASEADAPDVRGYLVQPAEVEGGIALQIDTVRSSPGVTSLRVLGPNRVYPLVGTAPVVVPLDALTDEPGATVLHLTAQAVTEAGFGPMTGVVVVQLETVPGPDPEPDPEPEPEPAAEITAPATLTVVEPWRAGDGYTYVAPIITGTPTAGPTVTWQFRPVSGGDWTAGAAWTGTVPGLAQVIMDVQLITTITPGTGLAPVSALSPVYRAIPSPAVEVPPPLTAAQIVVVESVWRPTGQTATFSPRVQFPDLIADTIQFTPETDFSGAGAWHTVTLDGDAFQLFATGHPVTRSRLRPTTRRCGRRPIRAAWRGCASATGSRPAGCGRPPPPPSPCLCPRPRPPRSPARRRRRSPPPAPRGSTSSTRPRTPA